jgi:hypothetical protein
MLVVAKGVRTRRENQDPHAWPKMEASRERREHLDIWYTL